MFELQSPPWVQRRSVEKKLLARRACRLLDNNKQQQHKLYLHDYNYVVTVLQKL